MPQCVTSPAQQVSAIQLDAYKKLLLFQLLKDGKVSQLPRYTSQTVSRALRGRIANVDLYHNIAKAYEAEPAVQLYIKDTSEIRRHGLAVREKLEQEIATAMGVLIKDQNVGLIKQVVAVFTRRRIQRFSRLFTRMTVGNIVDLLGGLIEGKSGTEACQAILSTLEQMESEKWARLAVTMQDSSSPSGIIVQFFETDVDHGGLEAAQRLTRVMEEGKFWDQIVQFKQRSVRHSESYLAKVSR